jgi:hypothetical protein
LIRRKFLGWLVKEKKIIPHIPVWEMSDWQDGIFSRSDFCWDRKRGAYICPNGNCLRPVAPILAGPNANKSITSARGR